MTTGRLKYPFVQAHPKNYGKGRQGYHDTWFVLPCTDDEYSDNYPANLAHYWATTPVSVSVHFCVSDRQTYQYVDMNDTAFQARNPGNLRGVGVELSGLKSWRRNEWLAHRPMIRRAAQLCAEVAAVRGYLIHGTIQRLASTELRARHSGVTQHADLTLTFGGTHQDLGDAFPWDVFWGELHTAYRPYAAQIATTAASRPTTEEDALMAVSEAEFEALARQVAEIHGVLVSGKSYPGSWLQRQLGFVVAKVNSVVHGVEAVLGYEKAEAGTPTAPPPPPGA